MGKLLEHLTEYSQSDFYPYHMPGHKRQICGKLPKEWTSMDITEIEGFDNLHDPRGILKELQEKAAIAYGAEESFYLVNGSTSGILTAVSAAVPFGGELLVVRNVHKSVYHAAYLRRLTLRYIYPETIAGHAICEAVTAKQVQDALEKYSKVKAVLIVSPTYEGRIADVEDIAQVVHEKGIPLIVDEAHGAHLGFSKDFATNSSRLGADISVNSLHKTLPSMTQTALLHCNGKRVNREIVRKFLHIYQTSSPSYVLMAGMEEAIDIAASGQDKYDRFVGLWCKMLEQLKGCQRIRVLPDDYAECEQRKQDIGKLVLSVESTGLSGQAFYDILLNRYHLQMEMACESYVLAMFTIGDTQEGFDRLVQAVLEIDEKLAAGDLGNVSEQNAGRRAPEEIVPERLPLPVLKEAAPFYEAWDAEKEAVSLKLAEERIAGEFINLYPPGVPIVVPGERLSAEVLEQIEGYLTEGLNVQGLEKNAQIWVLRDNE